MPVAPACRAAACHRKARPASGPQPPSASMGSLVIAMQRRREPRGAVLSLDGLVGEFGAPARWCSTRRETGSDHDTPAAGRLVAGSSRPAPAWDHAPFLGRLEPPASMSCEADLRQAMLKGGAFIGSTRLWLRRWIKRDNSTTGMPARRLAAAAGSLSASNDARACITGHAAAARWRLHIAHVPRPSSRRPPAAPSSIVSRQPAL